MTEAPSATNSTTAQKPQIRAAGPSIYSLSSIASGPKSSTKLHPSGKGGAGKPRAQSPGGASSRSSGWGSVLHAAAGRRQTAGTGSHAGSSVWGGGLASRRRLRSKQAIGPGDGGPAAAVVKDEDGIDVTPKRLLALRPSALLQHSELADLRLHSSSRASSASSSEFGSQSVLSFAFTSDSRSQVSSAQSTPRTARTAAESASGSSQQGTGSSQAGAPGTSADAQAAPALPDQVADGARLVSDIVIERDGDEEERRAAAGFATVKLGETETEWLLSIESSCVDESSPQAEDARERNERYEALCRKNKLGNESLVSRDMQTVSPPRKSKEVQASPARARDQVCQASESDIFDSVARESPVASAASFTAEAAAAHSQAATGGSTSDALAAKRRSVGARPGKAAAAAAAAAVDLDKEPGAWIDVDPTDAGAEAMESRSAAEQRRFLESRHVAESLRMLERAIVQNEEHTLHLIYRRGFPPQPPPQPTTASTARPEATGGGKAPAAMEALWKYEVPGLTTGRNVSCVAWNPHDRDTIAVGYGEFDCRRREERAATPAQKAPAGSSKGGGLILVWSLSSIRYPGHVIETPADVTSLSFSTRHPSLLAAGLSGGDVIVYSLAKRPVAALAAPISERRGGDPVWEVCWLEQAADAGESLVTAGASGRVLLWGFRRGLEVKSELMHLSSTPNPAKTHGSAGGGAGALRHAGALSLDFHPTTRGVYLIATESGLCHKCSASYSDQYLATYVGHVGPVVRVRWSPFSPSAFISAGSDWTLRLWDHDHGTSPCLTINLDPSSRSTSTSGQPSPGTELERPKEATPALAASERVTTTSHNYHQLVPVPEYPNDFCWSPKSSTVIACAAGHTLQLWDLSSSTMDPVFSTRMDSLCTCAQFSPSNDILAAGCGDGAVTVFRIRESVLYGNAGDPNPATQRDRIEAVLATSQQPKVQQ